jgi:2,4-diketo-3-deoxy-L-fuconate hydrolase
MRFVTFRAVDGTPVAGAIAGEQVIDLSHPSCAALLDGCAPSLLAMIERGLDRFVRRIKAADVDDGALRPLSQLHLLAPLRPGKVLGAAFNFTDALAERNMPHPAEPVTFFRSGSTVIGPGEPIRVPPDVGDVGYEAELAVVIGRRALRIEPERVMGVIAGYTAHNDVSGSAMIKADGANFVRGKNMPATSPLGPWLVSANELPDPHQLGIRLDIDGRKLQDGSTATMLFRIPELISWLSYRYPLEPGDVIATGTPAGVAAMHQPPAWLRPGTTITVEVEGIGRLVNPIEAGDPFVEA